MKKITILLAAIVFTFNPKFAFGQSDSSLLGKIRHQYSLLDTSRIYTKYFYELSAPMVMRDTFNNIYQNDSSALSAGNIRQLVLQHFNSDITKPDGFLLLHKIDSINNNYFKQGIMSINLFEHSYNRLKSNAIIDSLVYFNQDSLLVENANSAISPYDNETLYASGVWYASIADYNGTVKFILPSSLVFNNLPIQFAHVNFKIGDSWSAISIDQPFLITLDTGNQVCRIQIDYGNGLIYEIAFKFYFAKKGADLTPDYVSPTITAIVPFAQVCQNAADYNQYGKARYYVKFATNNSTNKIVKPFIFVEGIDFNYTDQLLRSVNPQYRYGDFGWDVFTSGGIDAITGKYYTVAIKLMPNTIQQLRDLGYDVILVDFERGADYVQKKAFALIEVIKDINNRKLGCEENVILGASMGGIVTIYALTYMEKHNLKHNCRLYISFDAPHLGASIPSGLQFAIQFYASNTGSGSDNYYDLIREGAQQMLFFNIGWNSPCYRQNLIDALSDWPVQCRNIAVTNGNVSGNGWDNASGNNLNSGSLLLDYWLDYRSLVGTHTLVEKCKIFNEGASDHLVFDALYTPPTGTAIGQKNWRYNDVNITGAPGGLNDAVSSMYDALIEAQPTSTSGPYGGSISWKISKYFDGLTCFIPAISALAIKSSTNYFYDVYGNIDEYRSDLSKTHFEAYKGPEFANPNERHVQITTTNNSTNYDGNEQWLLYQIEKDKNDLTSTIPSGSIYNFGVYQRNLTSVDVNSGGSLHINGNNRTGWTTVINNNDPPTPGSTFEVHTDICNNSTVNINGNLQLGDNNGNKGILNITSGSELKLNNGSTLTIYDNSKLVIQSGATLNITGTPTINLNGNNAVIEIQDGGTLNINSSSTFTVVGSGFVRFIGGNGANNITTGSGSIIIPGAGSNIGGTQTHKILEFASSAAGNQLSFFGLQNFQVSGGLISSNCAVGFNVPFSLNSVTYNGGNNYCFSPLSVFNSNISSSFNCWNSYNSSIDIEWCNFTGASLTATHFNNPSVTINFSVFNNCDLGSGALNFTDCSFDLQYDHFLNNTLGIKADFMSYDNRIYESKFNSALGNDLWTTGINFSGSSTASLHIDCTDILDMQSSGVQMSGSDLYARCGKILSIASSNAITLNTDATLKLDPAIESDLGNMDISGDDVGIFANDAKNIYINNAFSNFYCAFGTLLGNITTTLPHLDAYHNYWFNGHAPNILNYYSFFDPSGQFLNTPPHTVYDPFYLTTAPNIDNACPDRNFAFSIAAPIGTNISHPNVYSKTGNTHSTKIFDRADSVPYQTGQTLKHAAQSVFVDDIDTTQTGMDAQLNLHEQVLKHNFGTYKNQAKPVVDLVYRRMQQTIAMGIKYNLIQQTTTSTQINKLISVQDTLLNRTSISDTINRYILLKDKAFAMRLSNRRNTALTLLSQAHALADSSSKKYIEKWQCFIEKEIQLQDSVITIKQFLALVKNCGGTDTTTVYGKQGVNTIPTIKENVITQDINKPVVSLYPNPSFDNLNIAINNLEVETQINIQIIDIVGRIIQTGTYQASDKNTVLNIPLNLTSGTYFIKLDGGNIHEIKRFVVMK